MPRAVGMGRAEHFPQSCPFLCPGGAEGRGSLARGGRAPVRRRTRRFGHFALKPGKVFAPRRTTRRQCRGLFSFHRAAGRAKQGRAPPCCTGLRRSTFRQTNLLLARAALRSGEVLRGAAAPLSAAARGVSDTLPSSRAKCSLRGALRGGSAAACSACIVRRAGQNRGERRPAALGRGEARFSPRSAHQNGHFPSLWKMSEMPRAVGRNRAKLFRKAGRLFVRAALRSGEVLRGAAASLSAAARGVSDTLHSHRAACSLRGALRGGSAASGSACIGRRAGQNEGERRPAAPGRPLAFFGRGCTIPYRETCFFERTGERKWNNRKKALTSRC